jgi:hypothetical protein
MNFKPILFIFFIFFFSFSVNAWLTPESDCEVFASDIGGLLNYSSDNIVKLSSYLCIENVTLTINNTINNTIFENNSFYYNETIYSNSTSDNDFELKKLEIELESKRLDKTLTSPRSDDCDSFCLFQRQLEEELKIEQLKNQYCSIMPNLEICNSINISQSNTPSTASSELESKILILESKLNTLSTNSQNTDLSSSSLSKYGFLFVVGAIGLIIFFLTKSGFVLDFLKSNTSSPESTTSSRLSDISSNSTFKESNIFSQVNETKNDIDSEKIRED